MKETVGVRLTFDQKMMLEHVMRKQNLKTPSDALRYSLEIAYKKEINSNLPEVAHDNDIDLIMSNLRSLFIVILEIIAETDAKVSVMNDVFITKKTLKYSLNDIKLLLKKYNDEKFRKAYFQIENMEW